MLPILALIGRPNVGKSTLFNALTRRRDALVADLPGVTRDRRYGICHRAEHAFTVIDTGGLDDSGDPLQVLAGEQTRVAVGEADVVALLVDAREGVQTGDRAILDELRRRGKSVLLVVNKIDGMDESLASADFAELGVARSVAIAAARQRGIKRFLETVTPLLPPPAEGASQQLGDGISVAIIGRPNAGKSTLINRLVGEARQAVSDSAGTTRDAIHVPLERDGSQYTLIDTAGIRRHTRRAEEVEKYSIIKALEAIREARVVVLLVDARDNLAEQDLKLISHVLEAGRALVVALNKWDGLSIDQRRECRSELDRRLHFVPWAAQVTISALHGSGLAELLQAVQRAHAAAATELGTSELTRAVEQATQANPPALVHGHTPKLRYAHSGGSFPPKIVIHGSRTSAIPASYTRYLENFMRKRFRLKGTPVRILYRDGHNPWAGRSNPPRRGKNGKRGRTQRRKRPR